MIAKTHTPKPILIVGAGISGLTLARLLTFHGVPNIVFEASSEDRSQGYGITLRDWAYKPLLEDLGGVSVSVLEKAVATDRYIGGNGWVDLTLRDNSTGVTLMAPEAPKPGAADRALFRANRNSLRIWLSEGDVDVRYEHRLKSISGETGNITVTFENGFSCNGSLLVAADGVHSTVRTQTLTHIKPVILPVVVFHGDVRLTHEEFNSIIKPSMGDSNVLAGVGDSFNTPITIANMDRKYVDLDWSYSRAVHSQHDALYNPRRSQQEACQIPEELVSELESKTLVPPFSLLLNTDEIKKHKVYNWLSRSVFIPRSGLDQVAQRGIVFIGDSAHGMPIFGGEGGNHAMLDSVELTRILMENGVGRADATKGGLEKSMAQFYDGAYKRCQDAVKRCRQRFGLLHRPIEGWRSLAEQARLRSAEQKAS